MLLGKEDTENIISHGIWDNFQPKFDITFLLYNYAPFFERILEHVFQIHAAQNVWIVEFKHIFTCVVDKDDKPIGVEAELEIFDRVLTKFRETYPEFQMRLVVCGLKIVGDEQCQSQIDATQLAQNHEKYKYMIAGYDLVCEEEVSPPIEHYYHMVAKA